ncbi:MAG: cyclase family protein [Kiritimatiellae bacterium]|nr:cyclase family protein [Kiritimatiellia bacterium]
MKNKPRIVDVSGLITEGMWHYGPPLPPVRIRKLSRRGETSYAFALNSLSGTYLETAAHRLPDAPALDDVPPEKLIMPAAIIQVKTKRPREHITLHDLQSSGVRIRKGDALLVASGWDRMWHKKNFVKDSPHFTSEAMDWLLSKEISLLGGDIPCYDDPCASEGLVNRLFRRGLLILAPLVNLRRVRAKRATLIAAPPRVARTCAFPCRALIVERGRQ